MAAVPRALFKLIRNIPPRLKLPQLKYSSHVGDSSSEDLDKPIKYSTSKAATWKAEESFSGRENDVTPWYQPIVVSLSVGIFLLYFGVFREENDVDVDLSMSLYDRIEGLEEVQLRNALKYYKEYEKNYDTGPIEKRLAELEEIKKKTV